MGSETFDTVVIGAGQAGLSAGYHLRKVGRSFVILEGSARVGDVWRERYDSLRLFTPSWVIKLPGWRFPANGGTSPTKDELADYLEAYAARFELPVRTGIRVDGLRRDGDGFVVTAGDRTFPAANVIVASGAHRDGRVPAIAAELDPAILQLHATSYRNPSQLREGGVLVVGAGNSGADISLEVAETHPTWLSGPIRGHVPFDVDKGFARHVGFRVVRFVGLHVFTIRTPIGRKALAKAGSRGDPLVRVKPKWLDAAGVRRVGKTVAVRDGLPVVEDGTALEVANVIWCTGYRHDLSWIGLPIFGEDGKPMHRRGVVTAEPGLYFVGLPFQYALGSDVLPGVGRDAGYVVGQLVRRRAEGVRRSTAGVAA
ncbi:MAG TPA: NAD(P)-binding domain-containing protein [Actinomycetota bacterium]|nr:NAD(P)-binding domain-containing protein [Actinomycetota bacterium]